MWYTKGIKGQNTFCPLHHLEYRMETVMEHRGGKQFSNLSGDMAYQSFLPNLLPPNPPIELSDEMVQLLVDTHSKLGVLEGVAVRLPSIALFISMYVRKEALMSSQIEGTQATLEDVLDPMIDSNVNHDVSDVINYIKATEFGMKRLKEIPLCNRLLKEIHEVLMVGVRGQEKTPGEFRISQNWIGPQGSSLNNATYVPPNVLHMTEAMFDLEKYMNEEDSLDVLIRAALIHYQFETIHPFLDGNGRIGRLMITLFLMEQKVLSTPVLYISYFLKKNRIEYYDRMMEVRKNGRYEQWITFFLQAVLESATDAIETIDQLTMLHDKNVEFVTNMGRASKNTLLLYEYLVSNPIIETQKTAKELGLSFNTVSGAINRLLDANILVRTNKEQRNRIFAYEEYLKILRRGT